MRKWLVFAFVFVLLLAGCGSDLTTKDDDLKTNADDKVAKAENLLEQLKGQLDTLWLPDTKDFYLPINYMYAFFNDENEISGSINFQKEDNGSIILSFGSSNSFDEAVQDKAEKLKNGEVVDIENGIVTRHDDTVYTITDFYSNQDQLTEIAEALSPNSVYLKYIEVDINKYNWPNFLPFGEPTSIAIHYDNAEGRDEFNTAKQSVGYFNDTVAFWQYNTVTEPFVLPSDKLFLFTENAKAYYDEEKDDNYAMTANVNNQFSYVLQPISQVAGEQANMYYEKPENWEEELTKVFTELVKLHGDDVDSIQNGTVTSKDNQSPGSDVEKLEDLDIIDQKFYIQGITLGFTQQQVEEIHGGPTEVWNDESGYSELIASYEAQDLRISYSRDQSGGLVVSDVTSFMDADQYHTLLNSKLTHDPIRDIDNQAISYFYDKASGQVVKLIPEGNDRKDPYQILLMFADPNFYATYDIE